MNNITLTGRLTAAPELKTSLSGTSVATARLAVDRGFGEKKETDFIPIVFWKKIAETVDKYCGKGDKILINGFLQTRNYEDKNGNKRTSFEVVCNTVEFLFQKKTDQQELPIETQIESIDDDFPF